MFHPVSIPFGYDMLWQGDPEPEEGTTCAT